eukprot:scaffold26245_cov57-Phaeocystis_antarctica.AAC.2
MPYGSAVRQMSYRPFSKKLGTNFPTPYRETHAGLVVRPSLSPLPLHIHLPDHGSGQADLPLEISMAPEPLLRLPRVTASPLYGFSSPRCLSPRELFFHCCYVVRTPFIGALPLGGAVHGVVGQAEAYALSKKATSMSTARRKVASTLARSAALSVAAVASSSARRAPCAGHRVRRSSTLCQVAAGGHAAACVLRRKGSQGSTLCRVCCERGAASAPSQSTRLVRVRVRVNVCTVWVRVGVDPLATGEGPLHRHRQHALAPRLPEPASHNRGRQGKGEGQASHSPRCELDAPPLGHDEDRQHLRVRRLRGLAHQAVERGGRWCVWRVHSSGLVDAERVEAPLEVGVLPTGDQREKLAARNPVC